MDTYRLIMRNDFDGIVCAALLSHLGFIDDIVFMHPKSMQDNELDVNQRDIVVNLPYSGNAFKVFDHHHSETVRNSASDNYIIDPYAPSTAQIIHTYYGGHKAFDPRFDDMLEAVNKCDSGQLDKQQILKPEGWFLVNMLTDARTGLGRFSHFRISNYSFILKLVDLCQTKSIEEILEDKDLKERSAFFFNHEEKAREQLTRCGTVIQNLVEVDWREEETVWPSSRFLIYVLHPHCQVSMHIYWGKTQDTTVFSLGKSVLNRDSHTNIGELCLAFGGGGHEQVGTCQIETSYAEKVRSVLIEHLVENISP